MTWEQKLQALQAIADTALRMRAPGDWFVSMRAEIKQGCLLAGSYGNGCTPEEAVNDHWRQFVDELPSGQYIVTNAMREDRKAWRWGGFMWREWPEG